MDNGKILRAKVKKCINALNPQQPIVFGQSNLVKRCISQALYKPLPLPDDVLKGAESDLRNDMPLANDDRDWLRKVVKSHKRELENIDRLPDFARLTESKYILNYRNGDDGFDVHPLLRVTVVDGA